MSFTDQTLKEARSQGYSDDQIFEHLSKTDPRFAEAKKSGYTLDQIADHFSKQTKGGETDEGHKQIDPRQSQGQTVGSDSAPQSPDATRINGQQQGVQPNDQQGGTAGSSPQGSTSGQGTRGVLTTTGSGVQAPTSDERPWKEVFKAAADKPADAALAVLEPMARGGLSMTVGTKVGEAAGAASLGTAPATAGIGPIAIGGAAFLTAQGLTDEGIKFLEKVTGQRERVENAIKEFPELAHASEKAIMIPYVVKGLQQMGQDLYKTYGEQGYQAAAKALAKKIAGGGVAGTTFTGVQYGGEEALHGLGIKKDEVQPPTASNLFENTVLATILSGHTQGKTNAKIEQTGNQNNAPLTAKAATSPSPNETFMPQVQEEPPENPVEKKVETPPASTEPEPVVVEPYEAPETPMNPESKGLLGRVAEKERLTISQNEAAENLEQRQTNIGASLIADGITDPSDWSLEMMKQARAKREDLPRLWNLSKQLINDFHSATAEPPKEPKAGGKIPVTTTSLVRAGQKAEKAAAEAYTLGSAEMKKQLDQKIAELREQMNTMLTREQAFNEYLKGRERGSKEAYKEARKEQRMADKWAAATQENVRQQMVDAVNNLLPKEERGGFINAITNALKRPAIGNDPQVQYKKAQKVLDAISVKAIKVYRQKLVDDLKATNARIQKSAGVSVAAKQALRDVMKPFALRQIKPSNQLKIMQMQQELAEQNQTLPPHLQAMLNDLLKTRIQDLSTEELEGLNNYAEELEAWGRQDWKSRKEAMKADQDAALTSLANDPSVKPREPYEKILTEGKVGAWEKVKSDLWNTTSRLLNWASVHEKARMFIPYLFQTLDGKPNGWLDRQVFKPMLTAYRGYRNDFNPPAERAALIAEKHNLDADDFLKMSLYAYKKQGSSDAELLEYAGDKKKVAAFLEEVNKNGLTKGQQELYDEARKTLDSEIPVMERYYADNQNKELKFYDNYFPRTIDPRKSAQWHSDRAKMGFVDKFKAARGESSGNELSIDNVADLVAYTVEQTRKRTISQGFSKARQEGAVIPLKLNFMDTYLQHLDDWMYVKNVQPILNRTGKLVTSNVFAGKYGQTGKNLLMDYVDTVARRGQYSKKPYEVVLDTLRNRAMTGLLGYRLGQFKHLANYGIGISEAGGAEWWTKGIQLSRTPEGQEWIKRTFPELSERMGGDVSIEESSKGPSKLGIKANAFVIDKVLDYHNAVGITVGKYLKQMEDAGMDWRDVIETPVNQDFVHESTKAMYKTIGTPSLVAQPLITSAGTSMGGRSMGAAYMVYQAPKMARWGRLRNTIQDYRAGNKGKAAKDLALLASSSMIETGVKAGSSKAVQLGALGILSALGVKAYQRKKEEPIGVELTRDVTEDLTSTLPFVAQPISTALRISQYPASAARIASETGIPVVDMSIATGANMWMWGVHRDKEHALKFSESALEFAGLPISMPLAVTKDMEQLTNQKSQHQRDLQEARKEGESHKKEPSLRPRYKRDIPK